MFLVGGQDRQRKGQDSIQSFQQSTSSSCTLLVLHLDHSLEITSSTVTRNYKKNFLWQEHEFLCINSIITLHNYLQKFLVIMPTVFIAKSLFLPLFHTKCRRTLSAFQLCYKSVAALGNRPQSSPRASPVTHPEDWGISCV